MRVLILGGSGNVGTAFLKEAVRRGYFVYALACSEPSAEKVSKKGATPILGDIRSPDPCLSDLPAYAYFQQLSGAKARKELGWQPRYLAPENETDAAEV